MKQHDMEDDPKVLCIMALSGAAARSCGFPTNLYIPPGCGNRCIGLLSCLSKAIVHVALAAAALIPHPIGRKLRF